MSITYDIFHRFDEGRETRALFLDISKAFDKVWHKGLIYKLPQYDFTGNLLTILIDFLSKRKQRVVLNGQHSPWTDIKARLTKNFHSNSTVFADDTSLFYTVTDETLSNSRLNDDLSVINDWDYKWKMRFNPDSTKPTHEVAFSRKIYIYSLPSDYI